MRLGERTATLLWRALAVLLIALAIIGVFLPILPTVPFLIAAAWAGGKGWPALEQWLLGHPRYGPHIRHWRASGAVPRRAKVVAIAMMSTSAALLLFLTSAPTALKAGVVIVMAVVAAWLWSRPEP